MWEDSPMTIVEEQVVRARGRVTGRVQGVWFRASTREEATRLGLVGWVRNLTDGSVRLEAEGSRRAVEELLAWCRQGPPLARVTGVEVEWIPAQGEEGTFSVERG